MYVYDTYYVICDDVQKLYMTCDYHHTQTIIYDIRTLSHVM